MPDGLDYERPDLHVDAGIQRAQPGAPSAQRRRVPVFEQCHSGRPRRCAGPCAPILPGGNWRTLGPPAWLIAGTAGQDVRWITE